MRTRGLFRNGFCFAATALFLLPAVAFAQSVYVNYNHNLDFSQYHTYAWGEQENPNQIANSFLA